MVVKKDVKRLPFLLVVLHEDVVEQPAELVEGLHRHEAPPSLEQSVGCQPVGCGALAKIIGFCPHQTPQTVTQLVFL